MALTPETKQAILQIAQHFEREESTQREDVIREIQKGLLFWDGVQDIIYDWDGSAWRNSREAYSLGLITEDEIRDFSRNVNEYRAHGEAIIAALSLEFPKTRFFPKRASAPEDIIAARVYSKAAQMILDQNDSKKLLQKAFFIRYNQHFVACHTYFKRSHDFGSVTMPKYEMQDVDQRDEFCAICGSQLPQDAPEFMEPMPQEMDEMRPPDAMSGGMSLKYCENCDDFSPIQAEEYTENIPVQVGETLVPNGRVMLDVYGPLHVFLPHYASSEQDCPFLRLSTEHHHTYLQALFGKKDEEGDQVDTSPSDSNDEERWPRTGSLENEGLTTLDRWWIRPWAYSLLTEAQAAELKAEYPDGLIAYIINEKVIKCAPERLDHYWSVTRSPISHQIVAAPHGRPMIPVQEMMNDLVHLTMETIRHGVSITFADPEVLSFKKFGRTAARPGNVLPAKPRPGLGLDSSFYQTSHATLSKEVEPFRAWLQSAGQFVLGSFPSIYGGMLEGSRTFSEYESSRQQALQRLSLPWDDVASMFSRAQLNAVNCLRENMAEEETIAATAGTSFMDVIIRREEMRGEIGDVTTEIVPQYPTTWAQKRAMLFELLEKQIPEIGGVLFLPENASIMKEILVMEDLFVPGDADRQVQLMEIAELLKSAPLGPNMPSIMPDPELDNPEVHTETCRNWLNSLDGQDAKVNNPEGYANVLFHFRMHNQMLQQMMAAQQEEMNAEEGGSGGGDSGETVGSAAGAGAGG